MLPVSEDIVRWNRDAKHAARPVIECGGDLSGREDLVPALERVNERGALLNELVLAEARDWLARGRIFGVVGGDHSVPFGAIQAQSELHPGMGILHIDAHADLRDAYEGFTWSHASIMHNVVTRLPGVARLVQVGIRDLGAEEHAKIRDSHGRIVTFFDAQLATGQLLGRSWGEQCARIVEQLPENVYVSLDIDGLDPTLCPSTGTPVPGGLSFHQLGLLLRLLVQSGRKILGFDLDEVVPSPQGGEWDGNVGARVLYKLIGWTLVSRGLEVPPELPGSMDD
jgi:agmatinase